LLYAQIAVQEPGNVDRKTHWGKVYSKNSPLEVSWYQKEPLLSLQLIHNSRVALDAPIIDVGGGASVLVDYLCEEGHTNIEVLDIATMALAHAKQRLAEKACGVKWHKTIYTRGSANKI